MPSTGLPEATSPPFQPMKPEAKDSSETLEAARRCTPQFCRMAAQLVLETDYQIKTSFDEPERLLELLILRLAQEAKNA